MKTNMPSKKAEITLRAGQAVLEDGRACGRYLDEAAHGFFRLMIGKEAEDILSRAYMQPNNTYSFQNVTFAEREGRTAGMVLAFTAEQHREFSDRLLENANDKQQRRIRVVQAVFSPMMQILNSIAEGDLYVLSLAVNENARGQGIGSLLLNRIEHLAAERGAKRLSLDVGASNKGALKLYKRRGMIVESRWPKRIPLPGLTMLRMSKSLQEGMWKRPSAEQDS